MSPNADPRAAWARFAMARRTLERISAGFGRHGIDVLAVKGVITSEWLYGDRSERPLTDIDVRIRPRDFGAAIRASDLERWRIVRAVWTYRNLVLDVDGISVDIESYFGPPGMSALSVDAAFSRATRATDGFWVPEVHDHAVLLTINVFKDKMICAMPWALDDVERMVSAPGFVEATFVERLQEARVTTIAWLVADWMMRVRGSDGWRRIRALLGGESPRRPVYGALVRRLWARDEPTSPALRILARAASDDPSRWPGAVGRSVAWEVESRWEKRKRAAGR